MKYFHERPLPEPARPVGYAALIDMYDLRVPLPSRLAGIAERHHPRSTKEWLLLTPRHTPIDTSGGHLEFALKWEGVALSVLDALFRVLPGEEVSRVVRAKPTGKYTRRIWFLYEWLTGERLDLPNATKVRAVPAVDPDKQFAIDGGEISKRHRVIDNLPGTRAFCPLVSRTEVLSGFLGEQLDKRARAVIAQTHPDVLARAAAFLLLGDSQASFRIEGERPPHQRALRWGRAIGEAGAAPLTVEELERLQHIIVGDDRFVALGLRSEGGFVGQRERNTGEPLPDHISARPEDLPSLLEGLITYAERSLSGGIDPVITAAAIAFGFVFVHPFEDGNGRIHRWLIHHVLARADYNPSGIVFPVSAAILRRIDEYRTVLEDYSKPLLEFIEWRQTESFNVEVLNETIGYYSYFDATRQAEFLYCCVEDTVVSDLPNEVAYLEAYEYFATRIQRIVDMPESTVDLLHRFLRQGDGTMPNTARKREFRELAQIEINEIERLYDEAFAHINDVLK